MIHKYTTLSVEEKIGQLFMIGLPGPELDHSTRGLLAEISPGGICLFARNIRDAGQTRELTEGLRSVLPVEPLIAIDQEGGLVDRLRRVLSPMPAANQIRSVEDARWLAAVIAEALLNIGVNMDFAPVVDIIDVGRQGRPNGLMSRTFGFSAEETTQLAGVFLSELQSKGVLGCLKHFPGLGASKVDSHEELPLVNISQEELESVDLYPYRRLIASSNVHSIMVGHAAYPQTTWQEIDENGKYLPASLSSNVMTGLLRDGFDYDELIVTDDLEMGAIMKNYGIGDACVMAVSAGADMLAICADPAVIRQGFIAVIEAVRSEQLDMDRIEKSLRRISRCKDVHSAPASFDPKKLEHLAVEIARFSSQAVLS